MNRTNSKAVKNLINAHILESVLNNEGEEFTSLKDCKAYILSEFNRVANHRNNMLRIPNNQARFSDYLNGLPFNFDFYYQDIRDFLKTLDLFESNYKLNDQDATKLYHYLIWVSVNTNN